MTTDQIAQKVTDRLLELIVQGVNPWRKPWDATGNTAAAAISHTTGRPYSLINQMLLGFRTGEYATFNQIKAAGGSVKKGAKSSMIVFWTTGYSKNVKDTDEDGNEVTTRAYIQYSHPVLKCYHVFHISDTTLAPKYAKPAAPSPAHVHDPYTLADDIANDYVTREGIKLNIIESNDAFYRPGTDEVTVPQMSQYPNLAEYYSTLFHELTHSTGHKKRLDRFGSVISTAARGQEYSREELIAEIGAATALARLQINDEETTANSAAYLQAWGRYLSSDPKAFIIAAGRAEKAVNMIFND